jgi:hypothetical protein
VCEGGGSDLGWWVAFGGTKYCSLLSKVCPSATGLAAVGIRKPLILYTLTELPTGRPIARFALSGCHWNFTSWDFANLVPEFRYLINLSHRPIQLPSQSPITSAVQNLQL